MEGGSGRSTSAEQNAQVRQAPPMPNPARTGKTEFGWIPSGATGLSKAAKAEKDFTSTSMTCYGTESLQQGCDGPVDALQQLISCNPALLEALTYIERDKNGRISNSTLERIRDALDRQAPTKLQLQQQSQQRLQSSQHRMLGRATNLEKLVFQASQQSAAANIATWSSVAAATRHQSSVAGKLMHQVVTQQADDHEQDAANKGSTSRDIPRTSQRTDGTVVAVLAAQAEASPFSGSFTPNHMLGSAVCAAVDQNAVNAICQQSVGSSSIAQATALAPTAAIPVPGRGTSPAISSAGSCGSADGSLSGLSPAASARMASMRNSLSLSIDVSQHTDSDSNSDGGGASSSDSNEDVNSSTRCDEHCQASTQEKQTPAVAREESSESLSDTGDGSEQRHKVQPVHLTLGSTEHLSRPWDLTQQGCSRPDADGSGSVVQEPSPPHAAAVVTLHKSGQGNGKTNNTWHHKAGTPGIALHKPVSIFSQPPAVEGAGGANERHAAAAAAAAQQPQLCKQQYLEEQQEQEEEEQGDEGEEGKQGKEEQQNMRKSQAHQQQSHSQQQKMSQRPGTPGISLGKPVSIFRHSKESSSNKAAVKASRDSSRLGGQDIGGEPAAAAAAQLMKPQHWGCKGSKRPSTPGVSLGRPISIFSADGTTQQGGTAAPRPQSWRPRTAPGAAGCADEGYGEEDAGGPAGPLSHFQLVSSSTSLKQKAGSQAKRDPQAVAKKQHKLSNRPPTPGAALGQPVSIFSDSGARSNQHTSYTGHRCPGAATDSEEDEGEGRVVRFQPGKVQHSSAQQQRGGGKGRASVRPQSAPGSCNVGACHYSAAAAGDGSVGLEACLRFKEPGPQVQFNSVLVQPDKVRSRSAAPPSCQHDAEQQWCHKLSKRPPTPGGELGRPVSIFSAPGAVHQPSPPPSQQYCIHEMSADADVLLDEQQHMVRFSDADAGPTTFPETAPMPGSQQASSQHSAPPQQQGRHWQQKLSKRAPTPGATLGQPLSIFSSDGSSTHHHQPQLECRSSAQHHSVSGEHDADLGADLQGSSDGHVEDADNEMAAVDDSHDQAARQQCCITSACSALHDPEGCSSAETASEACAPKLSKRPATPGASLGKPISIFSGSGSTAECQPTSATATLQAAAADRMPGEQGHDCGVRSAPPTGPGVVRVCFSGRYNSSKLNTPAAAGDLDHTVRFRATESEDEEDQGLAEAPAKTFTSKQQHHTRFDSDHFEGQESLSSSHNSRVSLSTPGSLSTRYAGACCNNRPTVSFSDEGQAQTRQLQQHTAACYSHSGSIRRVSFSDEPVMHTSQQQSQQQHRMSSASGRRVSFDTTAPVQIAGAPQLHTADDMYRVTTQDTPLAVTANPSSGTLQHQPHAHAARPQKLACSQEQQQPESLEKMLMSGEKPSFAAISTADNAAVAQHELQNQAQIDSTQSVDEDQGRSESFKPVEHQQGTAAAASGPRVSLQQALFKHNPDLALDKQQQVDRKQRKAATTPGAGLHNPVNMFTDVRQEQERKAEAAGLPGAAAGTDVSPTASLNSTQSQLQQTLLLKNADLALEQQQQLDKKKLKSATTPGAGLRKSFNMFKDTAEVPSPQQQLQQPVHAALAEACSGSSAHRASVQQTLLLHNQDLALERQQQQEQKQKKTAVTPGAGLGRPFNMFKDDSDEEQRQQYRGTINAVTDSPGSSRKSSGGSLQQALLQHNSDLASEQQQQVERRQAKMPTTPVAGLTQLVSSIFRDAQSSAASSTSGAPAPAAAETASASRRSLQDALLKHNPELALEKQQQWERKQAKVPTTPGAGLGTSFNVFKDNQEHSECEHSSGVQSAVHGPIAIDCSPAGCSRGRSSSMKDALVQHNLDLALEQQQQRERQQAKVPTTPGAGLGKTFNIFKDSCEEEQTEAQQQQQQLGPFISCTSTVRSDSRQHSSSLKDALLQHNQDLALEQQQQWEQKQSKVPTTPGAGLGAALSIFKDDMNNVDSDALATPVSCPSPLLSSSTSQAAAASLLQTAQGSLDKPHRTQSPDLMAAMRHSGLASSSGYVEVGAQHQASGMTDTGPDANGNAQRAGSHNPARRRSSSPLRSVTTAADAAMEADHEAALAKGSPLRRSSNSSDPDPTRLSPLGHSQSTSSSSSSPRRRQSDDSDVSSTKGRGFVSELITVVPLAISVASPSGNSPGRHSPPSAHPAAADIVTSPAASPQRGSSRLSRTGSAAEQRASPVRSPSPLSRTSYSGDYTDVDSGVAKSDKHNSTNMCSDALPSRLSSVSSPAGLNADGSGSGKSSTPGVVAVAAASGGSSPLRHTSCAADPAPARASPLRRDSSSHTAGVRRSWDAA